MGDAKFVSVIDLDDDDFEEGREEMHEAKRPRANTQVRSKKGSLLSHELAGKSRTIYLGGLPTGLEHFDAYHQIFNQIKGAPVEGLRILSQKQCAFIDFFDSEAALKFVEKWEAGPSKRLMIRDKEVKVSWASSTSLNQSVLTAVMNGATRNIYIGGFTDLCEDADQEEQEQQKDRLWKTFKQFGPIDMVKVVPDRKIAFVHMASVSAAMRAVDVLSSSPEWRGYKLSFGSDRCGERPPPGVHPTMANSTKRKLEESFYDEAFGKDYVPYRTVYIGGLTDDISLKDLCDVIRGGLIQSIRKSEKQCAFVTFVEEAGAITFHEFCSIHGFTVKGISLRFGWSKPSHVPGHVYHALRTGATRTIFIGNIDIKILGDNPETFLHDDCSKRYGSVECVNVIPQKSIAFVSFCNLMDAVNALAGLRNLTEYSNCTLSYGKDRCAQPPLYPPNFTYPPTHYYSPSTSPSPSSFSSPPSPSMPFYPAHTPHLSGPQYYAPAYMVPVPYTVPYMIPYYPRPPQNPPPPSDTNEHSET